MDVENLLFGQIVGAYHIVVRCIYLRTQVMSSWEKADG